VGDHSSILPEAHVLEENIQEARNARGVPPVPLEVSTGGKLWHNVDTGFPHPGIGKVSGADIESAGSVGVGEDGVTGLKEGQSGEHRADL